MKMRNYFLVMPTTMVRGVEQDYVEAVSWYRLAAEQGYADAQYALGAAYSQGRGC